mmetsp:Transcript_51890/g.151088  ORF Transcript_51890/g.151088 Transcript_51890/m.151088 type:complete len:351 (+) Transcript_51890:282-1334(+)
MIGDGRRLGIPAPLRVWVFDVIAEALPNIHGRRVLRLQLGNLSFAQAAHAERGRHARVDTVVTHAAHELCDRISGLHVELAGDAKELVDDRLLSCVTSDGHARRGLDDARRGRKGAGDAAPADRSEVDGICAGDGEELRKGHGTEEGDEDGPDVHSAHLLLDRVDRALEVCATLQIRRWATRLHVGICGRIYGKGEVGQSPSDVQDLRRTLRRERTLAAAEEQLTSRRGRGAILLFLLRLVLRPQRLQFARHAAALLGNRRIRRFLPDLLAPQVVGADVRRRDTGRDLAIPTLAPACGGDQCEGAAEGSSCRHHACDSGRAQRIDVRDNRLGALVGGGCDARRHAGKSRD